MLLAIVDLGYQSCWYEGHITDEDKMVILRSGLLRNEHGLMPFRIFKMNFSILQIQACRNIHYHNHNWISKTTQRQSV